MVKQYGSVANNSAKAQSHLVDVVVVPRCLSRWWSSCRVTQSKPFSQEAVIIGTRRVCCHTIHLVLADDRTRHAQNLPFWAEWFLATETHKYRMSGRYHTANAERTRNTHWLSYTQILSFIFRFALLRLFFE